MNMDNSHLEEGVINRPDDSVVLNEAVNEKLALAHAVPGVEVEFDPEEAELAGAFREDALSDEDARGAVFDEHPHGNDDSVL